MQLPYDPAIALLSICLRWIKLMFTQNLYTNVNSSFIHNNQKLDTAQMFFNDWMVYPHSRILWNNQKGLLVHLGFPCGASGKESACQCRRCERSRFDPWVRKIPWRRKWHPTPVSWPGNFHGKKSLVGYSPWAAKSWTQLRDWAHTHTDTLDNLDRSPGNRSQCKRQSLKVANCDYMHIASLSWQNDRWRAG